MGELIEFRQTARSVRLHRTPSPTTGAHILLFTGVRYERHLDEPEPCAPQPGSKDGGRRRRKRASA